MSESTTETSTTSTTTTTTTPIITESSVSSHLTGKSITDLMDQTLNEETNKKESITEMPYSFDTTQKIKPFIKHEQNEDENLFTSSDNQQDQSKPTSGEVTSNLNSITEKYEDMVTSTLSIKKASNKFLYKLKKSKQNSFLTRDPKLPKSEIELRMNGTIKDNNLQQEDQEESIDNSNSNSKLIVTEEVILGVPKETEIVLSKSNNKPIETISSLTSTTTSLKNDDTSVKLKTTTNPIARILGGHNKSSDQSELDVLLQIDSRNDSILSKFIKRLIKNNNNNQNKAN